MPKKRIALIVGIALLFCSSIAHAGQKYNPFEDKFETVPEGYELKYDAFDNEWSYEAPKSELEYNPFENTWDHNPEPGIIILPDNTEADLYQRR